MIKDLEALFEKYEDQYDKFFLIPENKRHSTRRDLHAFILLDRLSPTKDTSIISGIRDVDVIISVDTSLLAEVATEDHIIDLIRCGVSFDADEEVLYLLF